MNDQFGKRLIMQQKRKDFAAAADARTKKPKYTVARAATRTTSEFFSIIYRNAQMCFMIGLLFAGLQAAIQGYFWASERAWKPYSALQLLKRFGMIPADPKLALTLDLASPGVALAAASFAIMLVTQIFIKRSSR